MTASETSIEFGSITDLVAPDESMIFGRTSSQLGLYPSSESKTDASFFSCLISIAVSSPNVGINPTRGAGGKTNKRPAIIDTTKDRIEEDGETTSRKKTKRRWDTGSRIPRHGDFSSQLHENFRHSSFRHIL
jgi:hypothetical protein